MKTYKCCLLAFPLLLSITLCCPAGTPKGAEEEKPIVFPLASMYATSDQKGVEQLKKTGDDFAAKTLDKICDKTAMLNGCSNIFLARGKDLKDALQATALVMYGGIHVAEPVAYKPDPKDRHCWLVVYFGLAHSGNAFVVESATKHGHRFRVNYRVNAEGGVTDLHQYFLWVPVGEVAKGAYTLELFHLDTMQVSLARCVNVRK